MDSEPLPQPPLPPLQQQQLPTADHRHAANGDAGAGADESPQKQRRSSSRSIKRKKFDDELVESSIYSNASKNRNRSISSSLPGTPLTPNLTGGKGGLSACTSPVPVAPVAPGPSVEAPPAAVKKTRPPPSAASKRRRHRNAHQNAVRDTGRWKPQDDLALVLAVQQTSDLDAVHRGVKFTCRFTLKELEDRWYALLYDPAIAKIAVSAMRQLHPDVVKQVHRKALFSEAEEALLKAIPSTSQPSVETFDELLTQNPEVFLPYRTGRCLLTHWTLIKHYHLLSDQTLLPLPRHEEVVSFSDAEEMIESETRNEIHSGQMHKSSSPGVNSRQEGEILSRELSLADRKAKRELRLLENEIPKWQVLVDSITGVAPSDFDNQTLAVLRGRLVRYLMRSKEITLGRSTKDSTVDVDLSLEGPASKISRKQGLIKLQANGDFMIANTGKRPVYVDSKPVLGGGNCAKINNNSVVEVSGLRFVFLINQDLIASVRAAALKSQL